MKISIPVQRYSSTVVQELLKEWICFNMSYPTLWLHDNSRPANGIWLEGQGYKIRMIYAERDPIYLKISAFEIEFEHDEDATAFALFFNEC